MPNKVETYALYVGDDKSHCEVGRPEYAIAIPSASAYFSIDTLIAIVKKHAIDAVHPGYGFLSESPDFARQMWDEAGCIVIGPGWVTLARTGDKIKAKRLAEECYVPVLDSMRHPTSDLRVAREFALSVGLPVMVKAVDGGGGRGIRLIRLESDLDGCIQRALAESPAGSVFIEKAAVDTFRHVEVQIVGDGTGQVRHLWERDCSVQRRFQKVVERAPATVQNRGLIAKVIAAALRMASAICYKSLGTFEFLLSETNGEFYFLEINPRLQVEHTITECISGVDLVQTQLLIAQGRTLADVGLEAEIAHHQPPPTAFSVQFRVCAEDPRHGFALGIGKVSAFHLPSGHGIRVDTHLSSNAPLVVGSDFDNLLAKIIVTGASWDAVVRKSQRVLQETRIEGIKTNICLLRGIATHPDFMSGSIDAGWLEANLDVALRGGEIVSPKGQHPEVSSSSIQQAIAGGLPGSGSSFRKGDAWSLSLQPLSNTSISAPEPSRNHLRLARVLQNDFPNFIAADVEYTSAASPSPVSYRVELRTTTASARALVSSSSHRLGDVQNPRHVVFPMSGKLMEILVSAGDDVIENQPLALIKQMKMELEIRSPRSGRVKWVYEMREENEDVAEGALLVELEADGSNEDGVGRWKL